MNLPTLSLSVSTSSSAAAIIIEIKENRSTTHLALTTLLQLRVVVDGAVLRHILTVIDIMPLMIGSVLTDDDDDTDE